MFKFRENRKRSPVVGDVSVAGEKYFLYQLLNSDATDSVISSWFLDRYQNILPKRITRLKVKEQRELASHIKRMRHLLIINNQNQALSSSKLRRKRSSKRLGNAGKTWRRKSTFRTTYNF